MILLKDIKGQDSSVRFLEKNVSSGRIANSYLFSGPEGVGRALTAKAFAASLMCRSRTSGEAAEACGICSACARVDSLSHPDLIWIKPEKNKVIKIEEARDIKDRLSLKPFEAAMSVCVIEDAHMLNREAANALLKVLEEPPGYSVIVLVTSKKELLPETVVSRCSEVRFRCLSPGDTKDILIAKCGVDAEKAGFFSYFSQGSPGKALEMIEDGIGERRKEIAGILDKIAGEKNASFMDWPTDEKPRLLEDIEMIIMFCRDAVMMRGNKAVHALDGLAAGEELGNYFRGCSPDRIYRTVERLVELKKALMGNINPKIVAQVLPASLKM